MDDLGSICLTADTYQELHLTLLGYLATDDTSSARYYLEGFFEPAAFPYHLHAFVLLFVGLSPELVEPHALEALAFLLFHVLRLGGFVLRFGAASAAASVFAPRHVCIMFRGICNIHGVCCEPTLHMLAVLSMVDAGGKSRR